MGQFAAVNSGETIMKFFISHKQEDAATALLIEMELRKEGIPAYLDVLDSTVTSSGRDMTEHIKEKINDCTDIIVIMSQLTRLSQWVPFEVGIAAQRDLPTATFLRADIQLPEFLEYWPRLKYAGRNTQPCRNADPYSNSRAYRAPNSDRNSCSHRNS